MELSLGSTKCVLYSVVFYLEVFVSVSYIYLARYLYILGAQDTEGRIAVSFPF